MIKKSINNIYVLISTMLLFGGLGICFQFIFGMNDDTTMQWIVSGFLTGTPDAHAIYMNYPLSWFLKVMYQLFDSVPWFGLFLEGCFVLSYIVCVSRIVECVKSSYLKIVGILVYSLFWCMIYLRWYIGLHYTVAAASLCAAAIFSILMTPKKESILPTLKAHMIDILLLILAYQVREKIFFVACPFVAMAFILAIINAGEKKQIGYYAAICGILVILISSCYLINKFAYSADEWQEYQDVNDSRTQLYDYSYFLSYKDYAAYAGEGAMSEEEYAIYTDYNLVLLKSVEGEKLDELTEIWNEAVNKYSTLEDKIVEATKGYVYRATHLSDAPFNYITLITYLFIVCVALVTRQWIYAVVIFLLGIGRSAIWIYLIYAGRYPERILISLYAIEMSLLFSILYMLLIKTNLKKTIKRLSIIIYGIVFWVSAGLSISIAIKENNAQKDNCLEFQEIEAYMRTNEKAFYWLDVYSFAPYSDSVFAEHENETKQSCLLGGWLIGSPILNEVIENNSSRPQYIIAVDNYRRMSLEGYQRVDKIECESGAVFIVYQYK